MKWYNFIFFGLIIITYSSCFELEDGCLDAVAVNFDVTADENCCCAYPKVVLKMSHLYGEDGLSFGTDLVNDINSPFEILEIQYYLSDFSLFDSNNNSFTTSSMVSLPQLVGENIETTDDFVLMTRSVFATPDSIGFFPTPGSYDRLEFEIGVKEVAQNTNPRRVGESFPLSIQPSFMWDSDQQYVAAKIILKPDTIDLTDTFSITIFDNTLVSLPSEIELARASHLDLNLQVNYALWFNGIDFRNDDEQAISDQIKSNLASSLSFF